MNEKVANKVKATLLEGLQKEGLNWFRPWKAGGNNAPINNSSGRKYRGFNQFILNFEMREKGYNANEWLTFNDCSKRGGKVKKGEKSTEVYFWHIGTYDTKTKKSYKSRTEAIEKGASIENLKDFVNLKFYKVFNVQQCEGIEAKTTPDTNPREVKPIEEAENILKGFKDIPKISNSQLYGACYIPQLDEVQMPNQDLFISDADYYKTLFHELVHATGHEKRIGRKGVMTTQVFNKSKSDYAFEELIAESGAMMLTGLAGLEPKDNENNSQAYINGWCKAVEEASEKAVVSALVQSAKAVDYITGE